VLLRLARDVATKAGDAKAAFAAIDEMQKAFTIDDLAMKSEALAVMAGKALKPDDRKALADAALSLVEHAIDAESLDVAEEAMETASGLAGKVRERDLTQRVQAARKQLAENVKAASDVQAARATLKDKPDDPDANLALGKYLCFVRKQWPDGFKRLAAGSDESLRALAQQELKSTTPSPEESAKLGDAWWNLSRAVGGKIKEGMMLRAGTWYQEAEASLPEGLVRVMVEKRLAEVEKLGRGIGELHAVPPPARAPFDAKQAKSFQARWARHLKVPVVQSNSIGMKLVLIPPGEFDMGSSKELLDGELKAHSDDGWYKAHLPGEGPQHRVRISKPYGLGATDVTQEEYQRVMGSNPSEFSATGKQKARIADQDTKRFPVEHVSWDDAVEFCRKLSELPEEKAAKRRYGLPTEAQWEHACRAGNAGRWCFSAQPNPFPAAVEEKLLGEYAWFGDNAGGMTHPEGQKRANAWGLYDMYGNVWQWCQDWYDGGYYANSPTDDPTGAPGGSDRVFRGGRWHDPARFCRSAIRDHDGPGIRNFFLGFRVSLVLTEYPGGESPAATATASLEHDVRVEAMPRANFESQIRDLKSEIPPPAVAPLDAEGAKAIQARWAKHLKAPVVTTNSIGMKLVLIPPGEFMMGSPAEEKDRGPDEGPQHRVTISRPFHMGAYPVTQAQYELVMGRNPSSFSAKGDRSANVAGHDTSRHPVDSVSSNDAISFCQRLSDLPAERAARRTYRLPTEAEWEYVCRAGTRTRWSFGDDGAKFGEYDWFNGNSNGATHPVGQKKPNAWGLYDVYGNATQWCMDWWDANYYQQSPSIDPTGPESGSHRVLRGSSWYGGPTDSASRHKDFAGAGNPCYGFRVVWAAERKRGRR
jgi:formylglycine-generating enzyme required for sulfatase activity